MFAAGKWGSSWGISRATRGTSINARLGRRRVGDVCPPAEPQGSNPILGKHVASNHSGKALGMIHQALNRYKYFLPPGSLDFFSSFVNSPTASPASSDTTTVYPHRCPTLFHRFPPPPWSASPPSLALTCLIPLACHDFSYSSRRLSSSTCLDPKAVDHNTLIHHGPS